MVLEGTIMDTGNPNERIPCGGSGRVWRGSRLPKCARYYFDQLPVASQDQAWLEAVARQLYFREQRETENRVRLTRPRLSAEDLRIHTWLFERMAAIHREEHGLWSRLRRLLFGN